MPIKFPKGFTRRKSSGNVLEEVEPTAQSSFRVFERPSDEKPFSHGLLSRKMSEPLNSPMDDSENIFAASDKLLPGDRYVLMKTFFGGFR